MSNIKIGSLVKLKYPYYSLKTVEMYGHGIITNSGIYVCDVYFSKLNITLEQFMSENLNVINE